MYIDLHAHLDLYSEKDIEDKIKNAEKAGLKAVVGSGICPESSRKILALAEKYKIVKAAIGLYPIDALAAEKSEEGILPDKIPETDIDSEIRFIRQNKDKIIAIGEIGLDYKTGKDKEAQQKLFRQMLCLAVELKKPVIIHSRKAEADVIEILEEYKDKIRIIMHCFCGKKKLMIRAINNRWHFTIPTHVVKSEQHQFLAKNTPLSRLFCETDSPFLSPFPEKENEPAFVVESYKKIAELKGMELKEVANNIFLNYQRLFS